MTKDTRISAFYAGRSVFITGATGFLGKVLTEKLLRSCPDIAKIFLLMRPKKGLSIDERLKKMLSAKLFDKLRSERSSYFDKLVPVSGDVAAEGLGLSPAERQMLIEKVSIIFHVAASVRFDESLKDAIFNNTRSTRDVCTLAKSMNKLVKNKWPKRRTLREYFTHYEDEKRSYDEWESAEALLHVSSTYTQTDKRLVEEILYPSEVDWRQAIEIAESIDEYTLKTLTAKYIGAMPNTYTFTKRLAEQVISDYSESLPCVILRPSIVISTADEPIRGWLDNFNGPIGMMIGSAKGILRVLHVDPVIISDYMPVDVAIKAVIITAWRRGIKTIAEDNTVHIYNCSSHEEGNMSVQQIVQMGLHIVKDNPIEGIIWSPNTRITRSRTVYYILMLLTHLLPALLIDGIMKLLGARPILLKLQRKVYVSNCALSYFLMNEWKFRNKKLLDLFDDINASPRNRIDFGFFYKDFDVLNYFTHGVIGAKTYLLNEDMSQLEAAKLHRRRMDWLDSVVTTLFTVIIIWILHHNNILSYIAEVLSFLANGSIFNEA